MYDVFKGRILNFKSLALEETFLVWKTLWMIAINFSEKNAGYLLQVKYGFQN